MSIKHKNYIKLIIIFTLSLCGCIKKSGIENSKASTISHHHNSISDDLEISLFVSDYDYGTQLHYKIVSNINGHLTCYLQSDSVLTKIYPNQYSTSGYIVANTQVKIPDSAAYSVIADENNETLHCFLMQEKNYLKLPEDYRVAEFRILPYSNSEQLFSVYKKVTIKNPVYASFQIQLNKINH